MVTSAGFTVTPGRVLLRTIMLPVAAAPLGLGLLPILLSRSRRGLHDAVAGTAVVYDWGDRPAQDAGPGVHVRGQSDRARAVHPLGDASGSVGAPLQWAPRCAGTALSAHSGNLIEIPERRWQR